MRNNATARARHVYLVRSAFLRAARLLAFGMLGWVSLMSREEPFLKAVSLMAVLGLAFTVSVTWYLSRAGALGNRTNSLFSGALIHDRQPSHKD